MINTHLKRSPVYHKETVRRCLTAEFWVLGGKNKSLRDDVEVFEAVGLLHPLDVFIQAVFARQFVRPGGG